MPKVEQSVIINRPIADVFDFAGRDYVKNAPKWSAALKEFQQTSPGGMRVGTTIHAVREMRGRPAPATVEITQYEPNRAIGFKSVGEGNEAIGSFAFEPAGDGTKVTYVLDVTIGGLGRLAGPMIGREIGKEAERDLATMKSLLEQ